MISQALCSMIGCQISARMTCSHVMCFPFLQDKETTGQSELRERHVGIPIINCQSPLATACLRCGCDSQGGT